MFVVGREAARRIGFDIEGARIAVQGFGNVGGIAARLFQEAGARVIAVQDHTGTLHNSKGIDAVALLDHVAKNGGVGGFAGADPVSADEFWTIECDILIPAALEGQITEKNAPKIKTKIVVEGANGPTTTAADDILHDKGVLVIPDVVGERGRRDGVLLRMGAGLLELLLDRGRDQPAPRTRDARSVRRGVAGGERTQGVCADGRIYRRLYADFDGA